ncbi:protein PSK SIMULATOR 1 isoform X2 [Lactuca sativa]|uniref:protein PSK SIMULATOR 1 isoform X2 n=1 Tax=Lactuca sativa TaxID=4236 RepID=UPI000CD9D70E|nr:protein PSK SIMULATOR 1 isoform X2 [Lactuca sativa]
MNDSSWFTILKTSHKNKGLEAENPMIGILSFEVSRLMCKVANLWHCLTDRHVSRLKEELRYSLGIRTLISDDHSYLIDLALSEIIDNLKGVSISVARLGKKCVDPMYHNLDHVFHNPFEINLKWCGWEYRLKKMEKRVKKMKKFANVMSQLHEELETLSDLETRLKKMQSNGVNQSQLLEFHQKVMWQREEVNGLRDMSPWVRTFDYIVRLLLRSLFTIVERIKVVFGITTEMGRDGCFVRKYSISTLAGASVYPSETSSSRSMSNLRHTPNPQTCYSPIMCARYPSIKSAHIGCTTSRSNPNSIRVKGIFQNDAFDPIKKAKRLSKGQEPTLGDTALALRYANIIIFIENLAMSPRYLRPDAREDLYDMLTTDWRSSLKRILDWLSPVAHNMIKWYSERNFEKQPMGSKGQVLLVQTLHYADQATSEIAITELLVGLHHVWRFSQEIIDKSLMGSA